MAVAKIARFDQEIRDLLEEYNRKRDRLQNILLKIDKVESNLNSKLKKNTRFTAKKKKKPISNRSIRDFQKLCNVRDEIQRYLHKIRLEVSRCDQILITSEQQMNAIVDLNVRVTVGLDVSIPKKVKKAIKNLGIWNTVSVIERHQMRRAAVPVRRPVVNVPAAAVNVPADAPESSSRKRKRGHSQPRVMERHEMRPADVRVRRPVVNVPAVFNVRAAVVNVPADAPGAVRAAESSSRKRKRGHRQPSVMERHKMCGAAVPVRHPAVNAPAVNFPAVFDVPAAVNVSADAPGAVPTAESSSKKRKRGHNQPWAKKNWIGIGFPSLRFWRF